MRTLSLPVRIRLVIVTVLAVVGLQGCGGGGDRPPEDRLNSGIKLQLIQFNCTVFEPWNASVIVGSSYTVASTTTAVCIDGFIESNIPTILWSNSAGGSGQTSPVKVNCRCGSSSCCQLIWGVDNIALKPGINALTFTATYNGRSDSVGLTINTVPVVASMTPSQNASGVALNTNISATFGADMNPTTITTSSFQLREAFSGNLVNGTVTYQNRVATFTPNAPLSGSTSYNATLTTAATSTDGIALAASASWSFRTAVAPDLAGAFVVATSPAAGSSCAPIDVTLTATFNESVATTLLVPPPITLVDSAMVSIGGAVSREGAQTKLTFAPSVDLAQSLSYTATATSAVKDAAGNPMETNFSWTFSTAGQGAGSWNPISMVDSPPSRARPSVVWTGSEMISWGGIDWNDALGNAPGAGSRYNPATDTWLPVSTTAAPLHREMHVAVWTGSEMIVWGGWRANEWHADGGRYNPQTDTWSPVSAVNAPVASVGWGARTFAIWTGSRMLVWGNSNGALYDPVSDSWSPMSMLGKPEADGGVPVWDGTRMHIWSGQGAQFQPPLAGRSYDPQTNTWSAMPTLGAPSPRSDAFVVWTGSQMIIWGGRSIEGEYLDTGAIFSPQSGTWQPMTTNCAPAPRSPGAVVWNGTEMLLWGGNNLLKSFFSGARYNPTTDTWQHMSSVGSPTTVDSDFAVWTGSAMILWRSGYYGSPAGYRYVP